MFITKGRVGYSDLDFKVIVGVEEGGGGGGGWVWGGRIGIIFLDC